jgi:thiol:disulfide interchange protein DsbC
MSPATGRHAAGAGAAQGLVAAGPLYRRLLAAAVLGLAIWAAPATQVAAQVDPAINIRKVVENWLQGRHQIDDITQTPLKNMYEVRIGTDLMYVDARAEYAFIEGQMIDLKANKNLTQARIDDLIKIDFKKDLPLGYAIKQVSGNGKRVLAVFEDPNCTYCKKLRADLMKMKDLTLYTFPYPILAPDSEVKARKAWCAKNQGTAWDEMMVQGRVPDNDGNCENPVSKVQALGRELNVTGTPTMFFTNGKRVPGAISPQQLEKLLSENS